MLATCDLLKQLDEIYDREDALDAQALEEEQAFAALRSGKVTEPIIPVNSDVLLNVSGTTGSQSKTTRPPETQQEGTKEKVVEPFTGEAFHKSSNPYRPPTTQVPYPGRLKEVKKKQDIRETPLFDKLSKVEINVPLLDLIRDIPDYTRFFKELSSKKKNLSEGGKRTHA